MFVLGSRNLLCISSNVYIAQNVEYFISLNRNHFLHKQVLNTLFRTACLPYRKLVYKGNYININYSIFRSSLFDLKTIEERALTS